MGIVLTVVGSQLYAMPVGLRGDDLTKLDLGQMVKRSLPEGHSISSYKRKSDLRKGNLCPIFRKVEKTL